MCGIWLLTGPCQEQIVNPNLHIASLKGRGPEGTRRVDLSGNVILGFTRLAINGLNEDGMQPMTNGRFHWMCNGEIYNWQKLANDYGISVESGSDCEVLGELYTKFAETPAAFFRMLDGVFSIAIVDTLLQTVTLARDPYGVRPLYVGQRMSIRYGSTPTSQEVYICGIAAGSELKSLTTLTQAIQHFPPGHYSTYKYTGEMVKKEQYHTIPFLKNPLYSREGSLEMACQAVRTALESAVKKRMMMERPVAALLSGGVDSSLIASLVAKQLRENGKEPLKTFSIGMAGSSDLAHARKVADWIGSDHHEIVLKPQDFFSVIPTVINAIESYDTTTVRASVGNWLVAREVASRSDCKVVFNGDGSDEIFGSYLYFNNAPSDSAYEEEVTRLLHEIHHFDVLRSDRSISSHGLEPRTPFLDKQFVAVARSVCTDWLRPIRGEKPEKWLLRRAFDDGVTLPHEVLWRRKEAFSDGVSGEKSWYEIVQEKVEEYVPDNFSERAAFAYTYLTPTTKEQYYYRYHFEALFGKFSSHVAIPHFWMPRWTTATDPSARTLDIY